LRRREYLAKNVGDRPTHNWEENYARETVKMADWPAKKTPSLSGRQNFVNEMI